MYACIPELLTMTFFCFLRRSDEDWRLLAFLFPLITLTDKNCSQTEKKAMQALFPPQWWEPRI